MGVGATKCERGLKRGKGEDTRLAISPASEQTVHCLGLLGLLAQRRYLQMAMKVEPGNVKVERAILQLVQVQCCGCDVMSLLAFTAPPIVVCTVKEGIFPAANDGSNLAETPNNASAHHKIGIPPLTVIL